MKRSLISLTALVAATGTMQARADAYNDFGLLSLLYYAQPLPVILVVEVLDIVGPNLYEPIDINSLNLTFNPADDQNDPQPLP